MIAEYLQELLTQKANLAENLKIKGVDADSSETLNTLVPKVLNIQNGGGYKKLPLFLCGSDKYADSVFTIFQNGIEDLSGYIRDNKAFCRASNGYVLNYSQEDFSWDGFVYTASTKPFHVSADTAIALQYQSGTTEQSNLMLIPVSGKSASDTIQNYVFTSIRSHRYFEVPFHWLYCETTITSLGLCESVPEGDYYLCWLGRSNNTHPLLKSVIVYQ